MAMMRVLSRLNRKRSRTSGLPMAARPNIRLMVNLTLLITLAPFVSPGPWPRPVTLAALWRRHPIRMPGIYTRCHTAFRYGRIPDPAP